MDSARAAVMVRPGLVEVREFDLLAPPAGSVLLRMNLSGICGTDKHTFRGESKQYAGTDHERDVIYPLICGHENVGTVVAVNGEVYDSGGRRVVEGDRVVPGANVACGNCYYCRNDYPYYMCTSLDDYGNSLHIGIAPHLLGGWAEYMYVLPGTPIFRVPEGLPDEIAVMTEVMAVTHGIEVAQAVLGMFGANKFGHSVAILGVGPLGMCHLAKAAMLGAEKLIATDLFDTRLGIAERFGASLTMNSATTTEAERIELAKEATDGLGPQIVIDCSGVTSTFTEALHMVRPGGVVIEAGTFVDMGPVEVNPNIDFCTRNVTVIGIGGETGAAYEPSLRLMDANQHRYPFLDIITHRAPLEYAQWGVETAQDASSLQVVIDPWASEPVSNPL